MTEITNDPRPSARHVARAFSLVELLTVIAIISLLIGILIPSISAARNQAKKATTAKTIDTIKVALEMFKNDNEAQFRQTNGYPPSFVHPPIPGYQDNARLREGRFPFIPDTEGNPPRVYGAHWLPAMLIGYDKLGYLPQSSVPNQDNLRQQPWRWYDEDPLNQGRPIMDGRNLYLDPGTISLSATRDLPGRENRDLFPDWDIMNELPVIVDAFDQPILYYAANKYGRPTNLVEDGRDPNNEYTGGTQQDGVPFYFHEDNVGFTGSQDATDPDVLKGKGWEFGPQAQDHPLAWSGADLTPKELLAPPEDVPENNFAKYIIDRNIWQSLRRSEETPSDTLPLRPVNADSFLLISAGPDGLFGTNDDVSNLPPFPD